MWINILIFQITQINHSKKKYRLKGNRMGGCVYFILHKSQFTFNCFFYFFIYLSLHLSWMTVWVLSPKRLCIQCKPTDTVLFHPINKQYINNHINIYAFKNEEGILFKLANVAFIVHLPYFQAHLPDSPEHSGIWFFKWIFALPMWKKLRYKTVLCWLVLLRGG